MVLILYDGWDLILQCSGVPMLLIREEAGAPLITSSSVPVDDLWFVLNQRTGWIRIDVYDLNGHIQNILVEAAKHYHRQFNPTDLAVQLDEHGVYHIAVALIGSDPSIRIYHWNPTHSS